MTGSGRTIPEAYVLWHPDCRIGEVLASSIYAWLRPGHGLGPDVYFRTLPRPGGDGDPLPLPLPGEQRSYPDSNPKVTPRRAQVVSMQILVLLVDCNMVADPSWRYWLEQLSTTHNSGLTRVFLPVALDSTAFNIPSAIGRFNFLRPSGLPLPVNPTPAAMATVTRSLSKQLTEALCRLLLGRLEGGVDAGDTPATVGMSPTKIAIFLSHAKQDGSKPARRIRDYIYAQTQLAAFFDENDIPFGTAFAHVIQSGVSQAHTAALIVILSAYYATRPWCRRELSIFRQPLQDPQRAGCPESWRLNPLLVVDALDSATHTFGIPEVGNSPHIRWDDEQADLEEQVVTLVLRDALLRAFHAALGRFIPAKPDGSRIVINWLPDPTTLLMVPRVRAATTEVEVCYPGKGLSALELETLDRYFPHVDFKNYEQVLA